MKYRDGLGHVYDVPKEQVPEFERRRTNLLIGKIVIQLIVLGLLIYWAWLR